MLVRWWTFTYLRGINKISNMGKKQKCKTTYQVPHVVRDVKFSFQDGKYNLTCVDYIAELEVPSNNYGAVVKALQEKFPDYAEIEVMSFQHA